MVRGLFLQLALSVSAEEWIPESGRPKLKIGCHCWLRCLQKVYYSGVNELASLYQEGSQRGC